MKILNFGSLNIDRVYDVEHFVQPGETIMAQAVCFYPGGKGLNQSVAAARAGVKVIHAGAIGMDGDFLAQLLTDAGADATELLRVDCPSGHAVIEVNKSGQNSIIVFGGANRCLTEAYIDAMLDRVDPGDIVLLQNETSDVAYILRRAKSRGLLVAFNPSPFPRTPHALPLQCVDLFLINASEGAQLAEVPVNIQPEVLLHTLADLYPNASFVLTLGSEGVKCLYQGVLYSHNAYRVNVVDTTAAGDTFCGYFLAGLCRGKTPEQCLAEATAASAIAVSRAGAAPSIPVRVEMEAFLKVR